jgi:hypothetical protein
MKYTKENIISLVVQAGEGKNTSKYTIVAPIDNTDFALCDCDGDTYGNYHFSEFKKYIEEGTWKIVEPVIINSYEIY